MVDDDDAIKRDKDQLSRDEKMKAAREDATRLDKTRPQPAVTGAISHPSVAAIVPSAPGGRAGPDQPNILIHAKPHVDAPTKSVNIPAAEATPVAAPRVIPVPSDQTERVRPVGEEQLERSERNEKELGHLVGGFRPQTAPVRPGVVPGVTVPPAPGSD